MPLLTGYGRDVDEHVITGLVDELLRTGDHNMSDLKNTEVTASRVECLAQIRIRLKKITLLLFFNVFLAARTVYCSYALIMKYASLKINSAIWYLVPLAW